MSSWKPTKKTQAIISAAASAAATAMFIRKIVIDYKSLASDFIPSELRNYIYLKFKPILYFSLSSDLTFVIEEYDNLNHNNLFKSVEIYLESIIPPDTPRLKISLPNKETNFSVSLERNEEVTDAFQGVDLNWKFISNSSRTKWLLDRDNYTPVYERRLFELSFHKKHKDMVLDTYLNHVVEKSKEMIAKKKTLKLHTLAIDRLNGSRRGGDVWQAVNLDHPANFETIAMDTDTKKMIMEDLEMFVKRKDFYRRVGKAWKRGYLLYGPPGTGKTSLIAAMANYLNFDVYDLELTDVKMNSDLRKLLISTANKSILVVEDIDCTIELQNRLNKDSKTKERSSFDQANQVTLSGLLNFIDGLWSSCGDERIIIFTTNHVEKLDPALLRPGRMDLHIHMSYCTTSGFRTLAYNYLGITEHSLFVEIEESIEITKVTPAEIGEQLMKIEKSDDAVLSGLVEFLDRKKKQQDEQDETANKVIVEDETEKMISNNDVEQIQKKD